jgi:hypothetical protein
MLWHRPGDSLSKEFPTSSPVNGQSVDADSLPGVVLARNGTVDVAVTVSVTKIETGRYVATCTIPSEYIAGDVVALRLTATVGSVTGRDTLFEDRLIAVDLTVGIASQLFVDGATNLLKVNTDHSTNGQVTLNSDALDQIAGGINIRGVTANQIAAALAGTTSVVFVGALMTGAAHKLVRGSAYLRSQSTAPYVRVPKALYDLTSATAEFRMKLDQRTAVVVAAVVGDYDCYFYQVDCDLTEVNTAALAVGTGHDQFWLTLASGRQVCLSQCFLEVIEGINVA